MKSAQKKAGRAGAGKGRAAERAEIQDAGCGGYLRRGWGRVARGRSWRRASWREAAVRGGGVGFGEQTAEEREERAGREQKDGLAFLMGARPRDRPGASTFSAGPLAPGAVEDS